MKRKWKIKLNHRKLNSRIIPKKLNNTAHKYLRILIAGQINPLHNTLPTYMYFSCLQFGWCRLWLPTTRTCRSPSSSGCNGGWLWLSPARTCRTPSRSGRNSSRSGRTSSRPGAAVHNDDLVSGSLNSSPLFGPFHTSTTTHPTGRGGWPSGATAKYNLKIQ